MIVTKAQSVELIQAIGDIKQDNYKNLSINDLADKHLSQEQKEYLINYIGKNLDQMSESEFQDKAQEVIDHLGQIENISISFSFSPTLDFLEKIHTQISKKLKHPFLLEVSLDKSIIGGVVMGYKGQIFKKTVRDEWN